MQRWWAVEGHGFGAGGEGRGLLLSVRTEVSAGPHSPPSL